MATIEPGGCVDEWYAYVVTPSMGYKGPSQYLYGSDSPV
jgi:hypothetical protein